MAEEGGEADQGDHRGRKIRGARGEHRNETLEHVPRQGQRGRPATGQAKHVGGAGVARSTFARVRGTEDPGYENRRRDRAEQVPGNDEDHGHGHRTKRTGEPARAVTRPITGPAAPVRNDARRRRKMRFVASG